MAPARDARALLPRADRLHFPLLFFPPRYFLRKLRKVKKANGQILAINEIFERNPTTVKNYGIWVRAEAVLLGGGLRVFSLLLLLLLLLLMVVAAAQARR